MAPASAHGLWSTLPAVLVMLLPVPGSAYSMVMRKCKGQLCENPKFPILDWNPEKQSCFCRSHPCHHDENEKGQRVVHACNNNEKPFLDFSYTADSKLQCMCAGTVAAGSVYIGKDLCAGHTCEEGKGLLLDYDEAQQKCICIKHPCLDDGGKEHSCLQEKFPLLAFHYDEQNRLKCQCNSPYVHEEL
mmetsp:Transcript_74183/g.146978  ORF Transcript_74183/g.146978 Transcript_74183/m.146978 type:complete len:188 (+) Transcript_74183:66-629(+)|eukprot:CAMPEP_0172661666 /NCGR_PEP_ID=MMETSP1074-20121228/4852_1 /TAXON_ID=2916 /ORGANISM="Ceratium fusus, Strain PA161109" /LENGTH=187 /DNA_ID=CAMNT_0013477471 /DNA_START=43 /DNA_END=606 /DNA_ORIENTATION=+